MSAAAAPPKITGSPPSSSDVVIVGGGIIGSAIAYFLASDSGFGGSVTVIERDPSYRESSTALSAASIRQQFSVPENIAMSLYGIRFLREAAERLAVDGDDGPALSLVEGGYLFLATPDTRGILERNHALQTAAGADIAWLEPADLKARFPWLTTDDVCAGTLGLSGEGWFDAYALLQGFRKKARSLGVTYVDDEVTGFDRAGGGTGDVAAVLTRSGGRIACGTVVNAAGARAGDVAALAGVELPVRPRRRCVFVFDCREPVPGLPLMVDPSGVYVRPEGDRFICGVSPDEADDPDTLALDVDYPLFDDHIWPILAHRVPAFEAIKQVGAWAGLYEVNTLDHNAILGPHPDARNLLFANGFSGHGLQQAPAVGRGIAEWIVHGRWVSLDLSAFSYDRIPANRPVRELNVV
ncbi:Sarcosine oxidase beta subunit [Caenispirillum salinarum AK4]|uniref:Sarcosine oxidase beta subunit n=1 Tax=Caenispirillum salinarum AK4 TaxID=1238182 RepID=K9HDZ9_9PROT|nr:FAD-binding oxidoreductase [Caenispirillum salinarum]EKV28703.1 Sarcosine oxidase beta subunit [Caenispirillum salinarum AK4]